MIIIIIFSVQYTFSTTHHRSQFSVRFISYNKLKIGESLCTLKEVTFYRDSLMFFFKIILTLPESEK